MTSFKINLKFCKNHLLHDIDLTKNQKFFKFDFKNWCKAVEASPAFEKKIAMKKINIYHKFRQTQSLPNSFMILGPSVFNSFEI